MPTKFPISLDRNAKCRSPQCAGHHRIHECRVYPDVEYRRCKHCGKESEAHYIILQYYYTPFLQEFLDLKGMINNLANNLRSHRWSKTQGKKDTNTIENSIRELIRIMARIDKWMEVPDIDGLPDIAISQSNDEEVYYKNKPIPSDPGRIPGSEQRSYGERDEYERDSN